MNGFRQRDGYVADTLYPSNYHQPIQPPWLDAVLALNGVLPPRSSGAPFTYVDLGCGDGLGLILTAAAHPHGRFIGVDIMPEHVARGQALVDRIGLKNISLRCSSFADQRAEADGSADYVAAHGVLTWISAENRERLMDLAAQWLRPGGAFTLSYNTLPGWAERTPFQALVRATAQAMQGDSTERFKAACAHLRPLGLIDAQVWAELDERVSDTADSYFAHEYLHDHWAPAWSGDVITAMAKRDMAYIGHAGSERLRDDLCLTEGWRTTLDQCLSVPEREIAADILTHCWFRRDVYVKAPFAVFEDAEVADVRMNSNWSLATGANRQAALNCETLGGQIDFDNAAAGAILAALKQGPTTLHAISTQSSIDPADILHTADALWIADRIIPIDISTAKSEIVRVLADFNDAGISVNGAKLRNNGNG